MFSNKNESVQSTTDNGKPHDDITKHWSDGGRYFRGTYDPAGVSALEKGEEHFSLEKVSTKIYAPRALHRYLFIGEHFDSYLDGKVLDMGSRVDSLKTLLHKDAVLVDKNNPTLASFDWEKDPLPFADKSFDSVVCLDTLEHINDLHGAFHDLLRVSKKYVIISLPNCWRKMLKYMVVKGTGSRPSYGLPPEKPMDRHKWFMNTEDIERFFYYQSAVAPNRFKVLDVRYHLPAETRWQKIVYPIVVRILPRRFFKNWFVNTVFVAIEKM